MSNVMCCVGKGKTHQGMKRLFPLGENSQCVAVGASAIAFSVLHSREHMTSSQIDRVLRDGYTFYLKVRSEKNIRSSMLDPFDLLNDFNLFGREVKLEVSVTEVQDKYPRCAKEMPAAVRKLAGALGAIFESARNNAGYLFTGLNYTVAFWRHEENFFLFNSHAVGPNGAIDLIDDSQNFARFFKFSSLRALAQHFLDRAKHNYGAKAFQYYNVFEIAVNLPQSINKQDVSAGASSSDESVPLSKRVINKTKTKSLSNSSEDEVPLLQRVGEAHNESLQKRKRNSIDLGGRSSRQRIAPVSATKNNAAGSSNAGGALSSSDEDVPLSQLSLRVSHISKKDLKSDREEPSANSPEKSEEVSTGKRRAGRPKKIKRGRPKTSEKSAVQRHREAQAKYAKKNPKVNREAVKRYSQRNPDVNRVAVDRYSQANPEVNRAAVDRYSQNHPQVNRDAVQRYSQTHPEVHREAAARYSEAHPEVNRAAVQTYHETNAERIARERNLAPELKGKGLIAKFSGADLDLIKPYVLEKPSLFQVDIYKCPHCGAALFEEERKTRVKWCCGEGAFNVPEHPKVDESFYEHPHFIDNSRQYNYLFAFSALGVSHGFQHPSDGIYFVKIQGRTYHRVFDLAYSDSTNNIGLYFDGGAQRSRLGEQQNLNQVVIAAISSYLEIVNPYIGQFRHLNDMPSQYAHLVYENTTRSTHGNVLGDRPRGVEVAALFSTDEERFIPKKIVIWKVGGAKPHTVDMFHPLYESFQYPLLYPHGTPGWHIGIKDNFGRKMSQVKYYRRLLLAEPHFSNGGKVAQEWSVDMQCRVEEERLRFIQNSQKKKHQGDSLRSAPARELQEAMQDIAPGDDETVTGTGAAVPGRIYLPNTFTGSPRYMKVKFMDGMALVSRKGKPSYFVTMTCNPEWPEIKRSTPAGQQASPALCARVFQLKLRKLLNGIRDGSYFGKKVYILYVIEFQKRGLPHAHICFRVAGGGPVQTRDIDEIVRADIPSPEEAGGRLRPLVLKHLVHGPCGQAEGHRTDLPCWDSKKCKCSKYFPKPATEVTYVDERGFVHLKRNASNTATRRKMHRDVEVNDCWIVPYNAALLLEFDCHLNVEIASTRKIVKYLFKYITKGPDFARVSIVPGQEGEDEVDEVELYVTKRYIGACEADWRIFEFDLTGREPNVIQLPVHLENQQTVFFKQGGEGEALDESSSNLLLYFQRPADPEFDKITYMEFYENYRVDTKRPRGQEATVYPHPNGKHFVIKRQRGEMVARMFWVPPSRGEQFYLRLLLSTQPARGFGDLKRLGGEGCQTFQEAARAIGLANDEDEYEFALEEASKFMLGSRLRNFFVMLLLQGASGPVLWEKYKREICEDLIDRFDQNEERAFAEALIQISRQLRKHGSSLEDVGLPYVDDSSSELGRERLNISVNVNNYRNFVNEWEPRLSTEQRRVRDYVMGFCEAGGDAQEVLDNAIFIDGPAGTGKTLLLNVITAKLRGMGFVVLCCGSSGMAADNHEGGFTAHSLFRFPLEIPDELFYWGITNGTQRAELIREAKVIVYDEAPMAHKRLIHMLDRSLQDLMQNDQIFGGKIIIFAGDFRQIPPVVVGARTASDVVAASMRTSHLWPDIKKFALSQAQRTRGDNAYSEFLLKMGDGKLPTLSVGEGRDRVQLVPVSEVPYVTHIDDLINFVFPEELLSNPDECAKRALLSLHNVNVRNINEKITQKVPGEEIHLYSADFVPEGEVANEFLMGTDSLNVVEAKGVPKHHLALKIGAVCTVMRNLSFEQRLLNGTKVIVVGASTRIVNVRKPGDTEIFCIPRIVFKMPIDRGSPVEMCRRQFPLQIAYAMTVNKSQGQTIDRVAVDLRSDPFSHGQAYVAFGRVRDSQSIKLLIDEDRVIDGVPYIKNIVYPQLLG